MKKYFLLVCVGIAFFYGDSYAQFSRYIIRLKDKGTNPYAINNPSQYLTARAIQRRTRYTIAIDSLDLPITPRYIDSIRLAGAVTILNSSKWLNQVAIQTTDGAALNKINAFPFVISTSPAATKMQTADIAVNKKLDGPNKILTNTPEPNTVLGDHYNYGLSYGQVHLHNGEFLHNRGFRGEGMQLAFLDAGFYHYLSLPTFDSIRNNNQVLGTWDFVSGNSSVDEDHPHGMNCLSTIAANMPGIFMGTAPKTSFYLYRTEDAATEYPIEEQNWAAAIERADSLGVDICSTSLGYTTFDNATFNYTYADMNGNTTIIARAADLAAKKGMLIVVAAGNEGGSSWHYISTPADADSVLAVGAVSTNGSIGGFSSYGPSSDGQIKPAVAAVGVSAVIANTTNGQPTYGSGTSFACPNMAGLSTCLWQAFPEVNNMSIINALEQSGNRSINPDDRTGYGIPDMKKAFVLLIKQLFTKQITQSNCKSNLQWTAKTDSVISIVVERKLVSDIDYLAINTQNSTGAFIARNFSYTDDLSGINSTTIKYRLKMTIAADTSFYLDSAIVNFVAKPNFGADKNISICRDSSLNLTTIFATSTVTPLWTIGGNSVSNPSAITASGTYQLIGTNISGCSDTALVTANFLAKPNLGADKIIAKCNDSTINLSIQYTTTGLSTVWKLNGVVVANSSSVVTAGTYQLIATNISGCSDTALVTINNDLQLCPVVLEKIVISPNPFKDNLTISIIRIASVTTEILIHNAAGQNVYSSQTLQAPGGRMYTIPLKQLAAGIYYVTVKLNDKKEITKKIMKQ